MGALNSKNLSVSVPITRELLTNVKADPAVFTPKRRRRQRQRSDPLRHNEHRRAEGRWRSRSSTCPGRRVAKLYDDEDLSGRFGREWNGLDDGGRARAAGQLHLHRFTRCLVRTCPGTSGSWGLPTEMLPPRPNDKMRTSRASPVDDGVCADSDLVRLRRSSGVSAPARACSGEVN